MVPNVEILARRSSQSGIADGPGRIRSNIMSVGLLSGLMNISIAAALVTLLLMHVWDRSESECSRACCPHHPELLQRSRFWALRLQTAARRPADWQLSE